MKHLPLSSPQYHYLLEDYGKWLDTLGYAAPTCGNFASYIQEMLHHLETEQSIKDIRLVKPIHVNRHVRHLHHRRNQRTGAGLSARSINHHLGAINLFARYLQSVAGYSLEIAPKSVEPLAGEREVLTVEEIKELYAATFEGYPNNPQATGQRDRAMLAVYYGCGLRKREGEELDLSDIDLDKARLLVRSGKGNRERYVPIARGHLDDLRAYIEEGREWFAHHHWKPFAGGRNPKKSKADPQALFLSQRGTRMRDSLYMRLKTLVKKAGIQKEVGLHSLRHSIATHLLQAGMPLEEIARFLGHRSLESTQLYTHIAHILKMKELEASGKDLITG